jgi:membrane protein YqaA with SNARE-associated domain
MFPATALSIVAYQVACTLFWPTPSEAPLLLLGHLSLPTILTLCVVGKVVGALVILGGWTQVERFAARLPPPVAGARRWVADRLARYGFPAYVVMQSVPFMPMRTSLYVYAGLATSWRPVVLGIAVGTVARNLLMLALMTSVATRWLNP